MAKLKERSIARHYYVETGKTAKEISEITGVSEQTLSKWINDPEDNWRVQRNAKIANSGVRTDNIIEVINALSEERLSLNRELSKLQELPKDPATDIIIVGIRQQMARVDSGISMWNKTLTSVDKDNKIPLGTYLQIMDAIFKAMSVFNEKLYLQTIDFQEEHINEVASRYQ